MGLKKDVEGFLVMLVEEFDEEIEKLKKRAVCNSLNRIVSGDSTVEQELERHGNHYEKP